MEPNTETLQQIFPKICLYDDSKAAVLKIKTNHYDTACTH